MIPSTSLHALDAAWRSLAQRGTERAGRRDERRSAITPTLQMLRCLARSVSIGLPLFGLTGLLLAGCESDSRQVPQAKRRPAASVAVRAAASTTASASANASALPGPLSSEPPDQRPFPHPAASTEGCPDGMVRVSGEYCPEVVQICLKYHEEYAHSKGDKTVSDRCLEFAEPSRCVADKRKPLDFCIDRYEYPNVVGELPQVLTSWRQAQHLCHEQGKRLCGEEEFNFACEGPEMLPYVSGYVRDPRTCNIDRDYRRPDHKKRMHTYARCLLDATCKAELERLDQRQAIGSSLTCVSWAGVVDLNGNVNEWVTRPHQEPPHRSGLKGGWWGPVRSRCRPTVGFHKEFDYGYEAGFRCCKGLGEEKVDPRFDLEKHKVSPEQLDERSLRDHDAAKTPSPTAGPAGPGARAASSSASAVPLDSAPRERSASPTSKAEPSGAASAVPVPSVFPAPSRASSSAPPAPSP